ncbi:type IV secretion system protein [Burkholderia ubonensis]|uniref:type IV secretion system protein n=1 Tax=Burkholderia ubonensis TaxID=101571 RepID=UPI000AE70571|nr:type IV secretion system protein [Burkholderia ubonensis]
MGLFSMMGNGIESGTSTYVNSTSAALSSSLVPVVVTALTVWVMAYGFAVMRGEASESIPTFSWRAAKIAILLAIALGSGIYQETVLRDVETGTAEMAQTVAEAGGGMCAGNPGAVTGASASSIYTSLDCYDALIGSVATADMTHAAQAGLTDVGAALGYLLSALIVILGGGAFLLVACFETILARVFLDLVLGLGPIFIACGAFEPSRRFFDAWVGKVVTYCLLQVLIAAFLGVALSVFSSEMQALTNLSTLPTAPGSGNLYSSAVNALLAGPSSAPNGTDDQYFIDAAGLLATGVFLAMLCWQLPSIASALGGGSAVSGVGAFAAGMASRAMTGTLGKVFDKAFGRGKGNGDGGSVTPTGSSGGGRGGGGAGLKPAYQRIVHENLNRAGADR